MNGFPIYGEQATYGGGGFNVELGKYRTLYSYSLNVSSITGYHLLELSLVDIVTCWSCLVNVCLVNIYLCEQMRLSSEVIVQVLHYIKLMRNCTVVVCWFYLYTCDYLGVWKKLSSW